MTLIHSRTGERTMDASTFGLKPKPRTFVDLVAACRTFVAGYLVFLKLDASTRSDVDQLVSSLAQGDLEEHEREGIFGTLAHMLFPGLCRTVDGGSEHEFCDPANRESEAANRDLDREEEGFARRLQSAMAARGLTQTALAAAVGVRQSAISMMLSRDCRPQRKTVETIASALGVAPNSLWPGFQADISTHRDGYRFNCTTFVSTSPGNMQSSDEWRQPTERSPEKAWEPPTDRPMNRTPRRGAAA